MLSIAVAEEPALRIQRVVDELDAEWLEQRAEVEHRRRVVIVRPDYQLAVGEQGTDQ